jgi:hypothetical protein
MRREVAAGLLRNVGMEKKQACRILACNINGMDRHKRLWLDTMVSTYSTMIIFACEGRRRNTRIKGYEVWTTGCTHMNWLAIRSEVAEGVQGKRERNRRKIHRSVGSKQNGRNGRQKETKRLGSRIRDVRDETQHLESKENRMERHKNKSGHEKSMYNRKLEGERWRRSRIERFGRKDPSWYTLSTVLGDKRNNRAFWRKCRHKETQMVTNAMNDETVEFWKGIYGHKEDKKEIGEVKTELIEGILPGTTTEARDHYGIKRKDAVEMLNELHKNGEHTAWKNLAGAIMQEDMRLTKIVPFVKKKEIFEKANYRWIGIEPTKTTLTELAMKYEATSGLRAVVGEIHDEQEGFSEGRNCYTGTKKMKKTLVKHLQAIIDNFLYL